MTIGILYNSNFTKEDDIMKYTELCMLSPAVSMDSSMPARCCAKVRKPRSKRKTDELAAEPEELATKHQRVGYERAHAHVAKSNCETAKYYQEKHEDQMMEALLKLRAADSQHETEKYEQIIQHHKAKIEKAKQDAVQYERQQERHTRLVELAQIDLKKHGLEIP